MKSSTNRRQYLAEFRRARARQSLGEYAEFVHGMSPARHHREWVSALEDERIKRLLIIAPPLSLQLLINGLMIGALFALAAYGMALVWGVMNVINITQGEFVVLGGYVAVLLASNGIHPFFAVFVAPIVLYGVGWFFYQTIIRRVVDKDLFTSLLATFGISILLQQLMKMPCMVQMQLKPLSRKLPFSLVMGCVNALGVCRT